MCLSSKTVTIGFKIPLLSQQNLRQITTGRIIDLISNDVQRLEEIPKWLILSCASFFEVPAVIFLLIYLIGWQALLGVLFQLLTVPYIVLVSSLAAELRQRTADVTDTRMSLLDELVHGIRVLKTHALERYYGDKIKDVRRKEVRIILQKSAFLSTIESLQFSVTPIATFLSVLCLVLTGRQLTPADAFMLLSFLHVLQIGLNINITYAMLSVFEAFVSLERIENFLLTEDMRGSGLLQGSLNGDILKDEIGTSYAVIATNRLLQALHPTDNRKGLSIEQHDDQCNVQERKPAGEGFKGILKMLSVSDLTCKAGNSNEKYLLENASFQAKQNTLTVITGHVGSGKSTLLASIAGEVAVSTGTITCPGSIAYFSQTAWIFSGTLRNNILFGNPYDKDKYLNAIQACALKEDMERFSTGDLTFVGERGVVLSGGQRARVSLARAVYADADVYLLDDPLSAVDLKIAAHIFNHCIRQLLQDKIRVMVTYAESHMKAADQVVVLHKGSVLGKGSFSKLKEGSVLSTVLDSVVTNIEDRKRSKQDQQESVELCLGTVDDNLGECLSLSEEDRGIGTVSLKLYWDYFRAGIHAVAIVAMITLFLGTQVIMVSSDFWLSHLTTMPWEYQHDVTSLSVYGGLVCAAVVVIVIRAYLFFHASLRSSERLHDKMVTCLLQAPVLFFDTNPAGRILNRFSKDIGCIDEVLPKTFLVAIQYFLFVCAAALVPSLTNFWIIIITLPVFLAFVLLTRYYLKTSRELKRLESIFRTPVFSHFSETMDGLDTIRTRKAEEQFIDQFYRAMPRKSYKKLASDEDDNDDDDKKNCHPATTANFLSILTFWWMNGLFKTGSQRPLKQSDFLPLHHKDRTRELTEQLWKTWNNHVQECNKTDGRQPKLWKCVSKTISLQEHIFPLCGLLLDSSCRVIQPLLLGLIIHLLTSKENRSFIIYTSAISLVVCCLPYLYTHFIAYKYEIIGMRLSSALKGIIYLKIPLISQQNLRQITTGRIIDLISNDVQRLEEAPKWLILSCASFFEVPAVICLLIYLIGWQALLGVLFQLFTVPYIVLVSFLSAELRQRTADVTDTRMSLLDELVHGIRVLKTQALERYYGDKIKDVRRKEVRIILQKSAFLSTIESLQFSVTPIATFLSVLCLVLTGQQLTPASAFMLLSFLHVLQIGLHIHITNAMLSVFEAFVSLERIENFLLTEDMRGSDLLQGSLNGDILKDEIGTSNAVVATKRLLPATHHTDYYSKELSLEQHDDQCNVQERKPAGQGLKRITETLSVSDLTCKAGNSNEKSLLENISFQAKPNTLTVITGHVGSGKSTLLASIAGEVTVSTGTITCPGSIAYFPQTAWIFSGSLRDNILFGNPYDKDKYLNVIQACALMEDIERFSTGYLTFVGERGVVLSGVLWILKSPITYSITAYVSCSKTR
ncbi:ATP-binding cassette sub-family C member 4-like [Oculina patagonica]